MKALLGHTFRRSTFLFVACLSFVLGIGLAQHGVASTANATIGMALVSLLLARNRTFVALVCIVTCGLLIGCWRGGIYMEKRAMYDDIYFQKITLRVRALDDGVYGKKAQLTFTGGKPILPDGRVLAGKISVSGFGLPAAFQGDEILVSGKLYPTLGANQARISYATLALVQHHNSVVSEVRRKFTAGMQSALPEPIDSFAMGLLVGQRATLPEDVKRDLLMVGLTHIIAVSGYNLTIMLRASKKLLDGRSKRLATWLSLGLIGVFLLVAGSSASIVRAAIVSVLSIWAAYYGRTFQPLALIMLAAAITAWMNPFYVWTDVSWYLSFLAFYGVMVLAPLVANRLSRRLQASLVVMVALESLCAEMTTLPFVLHTFGQMSFIGLLANVLVVALVPLAMLLGLVAGMAGMLIGPIAGWLTWPAALLMTYMLDVAHVLAKIPHIFVEHVGLSFMQMGMLYGLVIFGTGVLWFKSRTKSGIITDKTGLSQPDKRKENAHERSLKMVYD